MEGGNNGSSRDGLSRDSQGALQLYRHRASVLITFVGYVQNSLTRPTETARRLSEAEVRMM